jgi:hypothetical protein
MRCMRALERCTLLLVLVVVLRPSEHVHARPQPVEDVDDWTEENLLEIGDIKSYKNILSLRGE